MQQTAQILIRNGVFGYKEKKGGHVVLENIHLECHAGELTGIVGLNGVGKSTFLKTLCGLQALVEGEIFLSGRNINEYSIRELAAQVAIVLTERIGGFNLTTFDAVAAGQMPYTDSFNRLLPQHERVIREAMQQCGIADHAAMPLTRLSDGLFQKTMIARALAQQTPVLLLDEPSAYLDYASKHELFILLRELALRAGKCVMVSSHDLDLILKYCNRILVFSGKQAQMLTVTEARNNPAFKAIGGGYL